MSELLKTAILESALDCIITADHHGCITEFNPAAERTFGYRREDVIGVSLAEVIVPPSLREQHRTGLARYLATGEARVLGRRIEITAMRADGTEFPVELAITPTMLDGVPFFTAYIRDITERKRAERRLRRAIRARYGAVLSERARIAREMHDGLLQNLAGIAMQLGALLPHVQTTTPDAVRGRLKQILELTERTGREARQAVVGMRAGGGSTDLVTAVGQAAQTVATQSELMLSLNVKGYARSIRADVCDVAASIVREAMTNVRKHAHARGVKLSVTFGTRSVRLSVRDDGQGLRPHEVDVTDAGHFGLVGMRERATSVGARFAVTSTPGRGMVVRLDAPYRG
jgi:PAS domain S-box-containing protein